MRMALAVLALAAVAGCATQAPAAQAPNASAPAAPATAASHAEDSGTTSTLYDIGCLSASRCFAVGSASASDGGTLLATTDGGRTWSREASPAGSAPLYRIACAPPASCYVIARPGIIVVTHDAGAHWAARTLPVHVPGLAWPGCSLGGQLQGEVPCPLGLLDISCPSALTCYAVATGPGGWDTNPVSQTPGAGPGSSLWLTRDGGTTWTSQPIPPGVVCNGDCTTALYGYPLRWVSCAPSGPCWAGGNQLVGSHEGFAAAWLMTPAPGGSWRLEPGCPPSACSDPVTDVGACPVASGCYAVNNSNPFGDGSSTVSIYTATGQNGPDVTMPAGLVINDIACPAARTCYAAGDGGVVLRTTDGTAFTPVKTPARENLYGITCVTASACYAVGGAGTIEALARP